MEMKKLISIILIIVLFNACNQKDDARIPIGVNLPLSGKLAYYGNEVKDALSLLQKQRPDSKGYFIFEDNQSQANLSVTVFNKMATNKNIPLIISCNSPLSLPLRPLAKKYSKVLLALVTGAKDFGLINEWCYRDAINQTQEGEILADYMAEKTKLKKGASFVVNDDYGLDGISSFKNKFTEKGGEMTFQETFEMDERDMRSKILKILDSDPQFILVIGREQALITAINQIRERNKDILIITSDAFESPDVLNGLGENAKDIVFASYYNNFDNTKGKEFLTLFQENYHRNPGIYAVDAYVAGNYIFDILTVTNKDSERVKNELSKMRYQSLIKGEIFVNEKRDIISPVSVYVINDKLQKVSALIKK